MSNYYERPLPEDRYKQEFQLDHTAKNGIKGISHSYQQRSFYGKAIASGSYAKKTKIFTITENNWIEVKSEGEAHLMTYFLKYTKTANKELLRGTYTHKDPCQCCPDGKVYLEKTTTTHFKKEGFIIKRENEDRKKQNILAAKKAKARDSLAREQNKKVALPVVIAKELNATSMRAPNMSKVSPMPEVMQNRANELVKTIGIARGKVHIDLYDNGEIDGDTISIYHNNELIVSKKRLTGKPISFTIDVNVNIPIHEFVMVAENLGSIPPNTSLMVIKAHGERYEVVITSTEQKNAKVIIEHKL